MINLAIACNLHDILLDQFGGGKGIRDMGALEAALARPYMTFEQIDLYPNAIDKAAALLESLLINHPFIDGNKRTGYALMRLILLQAQLDISATEDEKYLMVIAVSKGDFRFDEIKQWLVQYVK